MKKIMALLLLAFLLCSCANNNIETSSVAPVSSEDEVSGYGTNYIEKNMPKELSIKYTYTNSDETVTEMVFKQNEKCIFVEYDNMDGILYILDNFLYHPYMLMSEGVYTAVKGGVAVAENGTEKYTGKVKALFDIYDGKELVSSGTETVAGAECDVFNSGDDVYVIEKATGICLKCKSVSGGYEFVCTEFSATDASIPEYK